MTSGGGRKNKRKINTEEFSLKEGKSSKNLDIK